MLKGVMSQMTSTLRTLKNCGLLLLVAGSFGWCGRRRRRRRRGGLLLRLSGPLSTARPYGGGGSALVSSGKPTRPNPERPPHSAQCLPRPFHARVVSSLKCALRDAPNTCAVSRGRRRRRRPFCPVSTSIGRGAPSCSAL